MKGTRVNRLEGGIKRDKGGQVKGGFERGKVDWEGGWVCRIYDLGRRYENRRKKCQY